MIKIFPKIKNFICTNSHPSGCYKNILQEVIYSKVRKKHCKKLRALIIGSSMGYGLSCRISMAFSGNYKTIGICLEKKASFEKLGSAGWYNNLAFESMAHKEGVYSKTINADSFLYETKKRIANIIRKDLKKIDVVIYSLASSKKWDLESSKMYNSSIKPILNSFTLKEDKNYLGNTKRIDPASPDEVESTLQVMGGEDWVLWIMYLLKEGLLEDNFRTVAFSYVGPVSTHPIYKNGSLGIAKDNLLRASHFLTKTLKRIQGKSFIAVNQSVLTQSSAVIPLVPSYMSFLNFMLKRPEQRKSCIKQMHKLVFEKLYSEHQGVDRLGRIRLDSVEMQENTQRKISEFIKMSSSKRFNFPSELFQERKDFAKVFGFNL